eukprot:9459161-Alexandrium_andersonii.AAC.1
MEDYQLEIINLQRLLKTHDARILALEARPTGAQSLSVGGNPSPAGSPPASAGEAAAGVGWNRQGWTAQEWASWRSGSWVGPESSGANAWGWYQNQQNARSAAGWSAPAD